MKTFVLIACLAMSSVALGQVHYCLSVSEVCCDANATTDTETTQQAYANFNLYWDTGSPDNTVLIEITEGATVLYSQYHCGCGVTQIAGANAVII